MKRLITGHVSSDKGHKTIVVRVAIRQTHPLYKKQFTKHRKFMAHDEKNQAKVGDLVVIGESRPFSAKKSFELVKIVERAQAGYIEADAQAGLPAEADNKPQTPKPAAPDAQSNTKAKP